MRRINKYFSRAHTHTVIRRGTALWYFHCILDRIYQPRTTQLGSAPLAKARILYTHGHYSYTFRSSRKKALQL